MSSSAPRKSLTHRQRVLAEHLFEHQYGLFRTAFGRSQSNRPYWHLVSLGLARMDFGPDGSWLKTYCFMPLWSDPVC